MSPEIRSRIYAVAVALGPLLAAYGVMEEAVWALWLGVIVAAIGNGTAVAHRPTKD